MNIGGMAGSTSVTAGTTSANVLLGDAMAFLFQTAKASCFANAVSAAAGTVTATYKSGTNTPIDGRPVNPAATAGIIDPVQDVLFAGIPVRGQQSLKFANADVADRTVYWRVDLSL